MKKRKIILVVMIGLALLFLSGCQDNRQGPTDGQNLNQQDPSQNGNQPVDPKPSQDTVSLTLYFGDKDAMYLEAETRKVEKGNNALAELVVQELIKGPKGDELGKTIPPETELISLEIVEGIAYVNFSEEIKTNHWGGSTGETFTVYSVVNSLAQLPEIDQVQFLIEGEKQEAIWGHMYTLEPIEPSESLLKK